MALPLVGCATEPPDWDDGLYRRVLPATEDAAGLALATGAANPAQQPVQQAEQDEPGALAPDVDGLTLDEAIRFAVLNHPDLRRSAAAVRAAGGRELQAGLYPNPSIGIEAESIGSDEGEAGEAAFVLNQEIVTMGKRRKARAVAKSDRLALQAEFRSAEYEVVTRVREAFARAAAASERLDAQRELLDLATELLDAARSRVDAGAAIETDRLRAEVVREQARIDLRAAEQDRGAAMSALASAVGVDGALDAEIRHDLTSLPELPGREETVRLVLSNNADVRRARHVIERARKAYELARAQAVPNVTAGAGPRYSGPADETTLDLRLGIELPLVDRNQGEIAAALAERIGAGAELGSVRLSLIEAVSEAWSSYESARFSVERYSESVLPKAQRTLELTSEAYRAGKIDYLRLLDAQQTLVRSRVAYVDALRSLNQSAAILEGLMQRAAPWRDAVAPETTP